MLGRSGVPASEASVPSVNAPSSVSRWIQEMVMDAMGVRFEETVLFSRRGGDEW